MLHYRVHNSIVFCSGKLYIVIDYLCVSEKEDAIHINIAFILHFIGGFANYNFMVNCESGISSSLSLPQNYSNSPGTSCGSLSRNKLHSSIRSSSVLQAAGGIIVKSKCSRL